MKKIEVYSVITLMLLLTACSSNEDKANKLIKQYMFETLYDFKSYEPTKTIVDTLKYELNFNEEAIEYAKDAVDTGMKCQELENEIKRANDEMDLAISIFGKTNENYPYKKAKREYDEAQSSLKKAQKEVLECIYNIIITNEDIVQNYKNEILGWKVIHKYRCNNRGGNIALGEEIFLMDSEFKTIINVYDMTDSEYITCVEFFKYVLSQDWDKDALTEKIKELEK
jgi:hypothetical protein